MQIIPSILEYDQQSFEKTLQLFSPISDHFQIDIVDESFSNHSTITTEAVITILTNIGVQNKSYEFHLMVEDPTPDIDLLLQSNLPVSLILVHKDEFLSIPSSIPLCRVLSPEDNVATLSPLAFNCPVIQIMTIIPGHQGNPFRTAELKKIEALREAGFKNKIALDGGIDALTISQIALLEDRPDILIEGSYLKKNPENGIQTLIDLLK